LIGVAIMGVPRTRNDCESVRFTPSHIVRRQIADWSGLSLGSVQLVGREQFEYRYEGARHLLIASERAEREQGETLVEGLPKSTQREFSKKLSLIPAGHQFHGWQNPRVLTRVTYLYIDPKRLTNDPDLRFAEAEFTPRLFFFDQDLWETSQKLKAHAERPDAAHKGYAEALGLVLAHELLRLNRGVSLSPANVRGGLAAWQKKRTAEYIEEHLSDDISLSALAEVAGLSPFHFSRAFKESFGLPPYRYLNERRMQIAKTFLARPDMSITQIALELGFSESSSFSTAFRKHTGFTPTDYRRSLA
jgi:AraC family transcriptional regulator